MFPLGVTIPATVPQKSEIPEGLMDDPVYDFLTEIMHAVFVVKGLSEGGRHQDNHKYA